MPTRLNGSVLRAGSVRRVGSLPGTGTLWISPAPGDGNARPVRASDRKGKRGSGEWSGEWSGEGSGESEAGRGAAAVRPVRQTAAVHTAAKATGRHLMGPEHREAAGAGCAMTLRPGR
ncbi:hypothetical protein SCWH03_22490 [Streptomyces pacificus]|uniref:Uncharacterized protein n=1 Tax=Streptomyces pacificus TaxID=2705029 RepID=A0A6A0AWS1_9ACTN|nr:hypothetical protein SCWH03_22490 [Streptomyces pacificus]